MMSDTLPSINNGVPTKTVQELVTEAARKNITCEFRVLPSAFNIDPIEIHASDIQNIPEHILTTHVINMRGIGKNKQLYLLTIGTDVHMLVKTWNNEPEVTLYPGLKEAWDAMCDAMGDAYEFHFNFNGRGTPWCDILEHAKSIIKDQGEYRTNRIYLSPLTGRIYPDNGMKTTFHIAVIPHGQSSGLILERDSV